MSGKCTSILMALAIVLAAPISSWAAEGKDPEGKNLFLKYKCRACHSIEAAGIVKSAEAGEGEAESASKSKPPDLSGVGVKKNAEWISKFLLKQEKLDGKLHMKKFRGTEKELAALSAWLGTLKAEKGSKASKSATRESPEKAEKAEATEKADEDGTTEPADSVKVAPETEGK